MKHITLLSAIMIGCMAASGISATPDAVDVAEQKGAAWLMNREKDGSWEVVPAPTPADVKTLKGQSAQWSGLTAVSAYALVCAGVSNSDPHITAAADFLAEHENIGSYALGCRCLFWSSIHLTPKLRAAALRDFNLLLHSMHSKPPAMGMYGYLPPANANATDYDHSVSQFGALGLWSLGKQGFEVPSDAWHMVDKGWRAGQSADGGWRYVNTGVGDYGRNTIEMTAAGVATLFITNEVLNSSAICRGNTADASIDKGIAWISDHFNDITDINGAMSPNGSTEHVYTRCYTLYGISRIGVAAGYKYLGKVNWYDEGSDILLKCQFPDGSWSDGYGGAPAATPLGVLFLAYGSAPVVMNKLEYPGAKGKPSHWNQRPQDVLNLANWMGKQLEYRVNWQIVNLSTASAAGLHDAPILYITGDETLTFDQASKDRLRQFVEEGGMIVGNPDCDSIAFSNTFIKLGHELFPTYEFRPLPKDHLIFTNEQYTASHWKSDVTVMGLSNGVRELMLLPQVDMSKVFQLQNSAAHPQTYELADNIVLYAMDKEGLRKKGNSYVVTEDPAIVTDKEIKLLRLQCPGNTDPEPGGWRRMAAILHNKDKIKLTVENVNLGEGKLTGAKLAHLTGTESVSLSDAKRQELKQFIAAGGTLIVDSAGGSTRFALSIESELAKILGPDFTKALATPLPPTSAIYTRPDSEITSFKYRSYAKARSVGSLKTPRVFGVEQGGRIVCFYSREDLSAGLVGQPIDGILGYTPETATDIMRNIILSVER